MDMAPSLGERAGELRELADFLYKYAYYTVVGPTYLRPPCCPKRKRPQDWLPRFFFRKEELPPPPEPKKEAEKPPVFPNGTEVVIDGLVSETGKALNGRCGVVRGQRADRALVQLASEDPEADWKRVKTDNLMPAGSGKCRYCQEGGDQVPLSAVGEGEAARPQCAARAYAAFLKERVAKFQKALPPQCPETGIPYVGRVAALCLDAYLEEFKAADHTKTSSRYLQEPLLRYFEAHYGVDHVELMRPLAALAKWYEDNNDQNAWHDILRRRRAICEKHYGTECEEFADCLFQLSIFWTKFGDMEKGRPLMQRGSQIKARLREKKERENAQQEQPSTGED